MNSDGPIEIDPALHVAVSVMPAWIDAQACASRSANRWMAAIPPIHCADVAKLVPMLLLLPATQL
jgi:hypothetical protein